MFRLTAAQLISTGTCRASDIIKTFGVSKSSIDLALRKYRKGGAEAFFQARCSHRSGTVMTPDVIQESQRLLDGYASRQEVAEELEIPYGGVLCALPALLSNGLLSGMDKCLGKLGGYYHGHKTKLPRKYVSRQRLCLRGVTGYWVNDAIGRPFFVIDKVADPRLLKVLSEEIVPHLLKEVPHQPSQEELAADPYLCRFILVFDREGYSPVFFRDMWRNHRIACITYHKHPSEAWPESSFTEEVVDMPNGETVTMKLAERGTLVGTGKEALWTTRPRGSIRERIRGWFATSSPPT